MSSKNKVLSSILGLLILTTIGAIVYVSLSPPVGQRFTEFYVLGTEGKAEGYPEELVVGEEGKVILGIINHEYQEISYHVVLRINGIVNGEVGSVVLGHQEHWEQEISFTLREAGENQGVEFLLFKEGDDEPFNSLSLHPIHVKEKG